MNGKDKSRRKFIRTSVGASLAVTGGVILHHVNDRKATFIARDGKVYEVRVRDLRRAAHLKFKSHQDVTTWIQDRDHG